MSNQYKLIICIFGCATIEKYKLEILKINDTWGKKADELNVKVLFFLGEEKTDLIDESKYIYLKGVNNDYTSASHKQNLGLKYIYENYKTEYIHICGTDTYINIPKLLLTLNSFNHTQKLFIGGDPDIRFLGNNNIYFFNGGSGFIISYPVLQELYNKLSNMFTDWENECINTDKHNLITACDVAIAYYISKIKDIIYISLYNSFKLCNHRGIKLNKYHCCWNKIEEIIACHYMTLNDFDEYTEILEKNNYYIDTNVYFEYWMSRYI